VTQSGGSKADDEKSQARNLTAGRDHQMYPSFQHLCILTGFINLYLIIRALGTLCIYAKWKLGSLYWEIYGLYGLGACELVKKTASSIYDSTHA
jgi:hypothetical protein